MFWIKLNFDLPKWLKKLGRKSTVKTIDSKNITGIHLTDKCYGREFYKDRRKSE